MLCLFLFRGSRALWLSCCRFRFLRSARARGTRLCRRRVRELENGRLDPHDAFFNSRTLFAEADHVILAGHIVEVELPGHLVGKPALHARPSRHGRIHHFAEPFIAQDSPPNRIDPLFKRFD